MYGFIVDGFPATQGQLNLLTAMRLEPNVVVQLVQREDDAQDRHSKKKVDPITGIEHNIGNALVDPVIRKRLRPSNNNAQYVANGFAAWNHNLTLLEDHFGDDLETVAATGVSVSQANQAISEIIFAKLVGSEFEFTLKN